MEVIASFWNSLDTNMKCAMGFMVWLIIIMSLANAGASAGRGKRY